MSLRADVAIAYRREGFFFASIRVYQMSDRCRKKTNSNSNSNSTRKDEENENSIDANCKLGFSNHTLCREVKTIRTATIHSPSCSLALLGHAIL